MDWLWLFLALIGLGLLWMLIVGMEKLTERLKDHDEARRMAAKKMAERTAEAEAEFISQAYEKASAKAFIETADLNDSNPENDEALNEAINTLSTRELVRSMTKRVFGNPQGTEQITATQSALDLAPTQKVVAKGDGVTPVKAKTAGKSALSKTEQKMLKKIKQGD